MTAEFCRAAVLGRRYHFELTGAHMAGSGLTPCRSMAAENMRDLQRRAGPSRGPLRGLVFHVPVGLLVVCEAGRARTEITARSSSTRRALDLRDHAGGTHPTKAQTCVAPARTPAARPIAGDCGCWQPTGAIVAKTQEIRLYASVPTCRTVFEYVGIVLLVRREGFVRRRFKT
jgi:hypothetical protein